MTNYNLYDILFEEAPPKKVDSRAQMAANRAEREAYKSAGELPKPSPSGKVGYSMQQLVSGIQGKIDQEIPAISKIAKDPDLSKDDIKTAKKALDGVENSVDTIAQIKGFEVQTSVPKEKEAAPQPKQQPPPPPAKTEPQIRIAKTQEVPQVDIQDIIRQQANMRAYPEAQRQAEINKARMQGAKTENLPVKQPNLFQRLKQRVGLEEAIREAISEGFKQESR